jgi:hypothetical protein
MGAVIVDGRRTSRRASMAGRVASKVALYLETKTIAYAVG